MSYPYHLAVDNYQGEINGISIRWSSTARSRLQGDAVRTGESMYTLKVVSENFAYLLAYRLQNSDVVITGAPHETTTNSANGQVQADGNHISAQIQGPPSGGRKKAHIYLEGVTRGPGGYDNVSVRGEDVQVKRGKHSTRDPSLCTGTYPEGGAGSSASGQGGPYTNWELDEDGVLCRRYNYGSGQWEYQEGQSGDSGQGSTASQSEWVWSAEYQRYYNSRTGEWQ